MKKQENKTFIFLYPQQEIFDHEIDRGSIHLTEEWEKQRGYLFDEEFKAAKTEEELEELRKLARKDRADFFKPLYASKLNSCINHRYRRNGFQIVYALLDNEPVSDIIMRKPEDRIIYVGMDAKTHRTERADGTHPYPNQDFIIDQLLPLDLLRIGGFHMRDCVEKLAKRAYERRIEVLVDEDLTEFFRGRLFDRDFRVKTYQSYILPVDKLSREMFLAARKNKPWLWQKYQ